MSTIYNVVSSFGWHALYQDLEWQKQEYASVY